MMGTNRHGRLALLSAIVLGGGLVVGVAVLHLVGWTIMGAALLVVIPQTIYGVVAQFHVCRRLGIPLARFVRDGFGVPVACSVVLGLVLNLLRWSSDGDAAFELSTGLAWGLTLQVILYWRFLLTPETRALVVGRLTI